MMKNVIKSILALAMVALVGTAEATGTFYARCTVQVKPDGKGLLAVYTDETDNPSYQTSSHQSDVKSGFSLFHSSADIDFYCYSKSTDWVSDFLYWKNASGTQLSTSTTYKYTINSKKSKSSPQEETIYGYFHVHTLEYVADGLTITYHCSDTEGNCVSKPSKTATLTAENKVYDGTAYVATVSGVESSAVKFSYAAKEGSSLTEGNAVNKGDYTVTMTYGDKTVSKDFSITAAQIDAISLVQDEFYYDGTEKTAVLNPVTANGLTLTEDTDYTVSGNKATGVATADTTNTVTVTSINPNFASPTEGVKWVIKGHSHSWTFKANGAKLTATCQNTTSPCPAGGTTTATLTMTTAGSDGVAPVFEISNWDTFYANVTKNGQTAEKGEITFKRTTDDGAETAKWYVGNYTASCIITVDGVEKTVTQDFSIAKSGEYTTGWAVSGSRDIRYDSWAEALNAAAAGDTIYYRNGSITDKTSLDYSTDKDITLDFGGTATTITYQLGEGKGEGSDITIINSGSGKLTINNVTLKQPYGYEWVWSSLSYEKVSHNFNMQGNFAFGALVMTVADGDNYTVYSTSGLLEVVGGAYISKFAENGGSVEISGGLYYKSDHCKPYADVLKANHIVRVTTVKDKDGKDVEWYQVVYHEHHVAYSATDNVITATCDADDHAYCGYGTHTATLNAPDKQDDGQAYALAEIVYSDGFPEKTGTITYWNGDQEISAPTTFGSYTAKTTIGGVTAVKAFQVIHVHNFVYDKDETAGTITARCTTTAGCDFNTNKRTATLTVQDGTYNAAEQALASVTKNTEDFPTDVTLTYSPEGTPKNAGDYTATMAAGGVSVTKSFTIAKASMDNVTITLSGESMDYTGGKQSVSIGSVKFGDYTLTKDVDYTVDESSVFETAGSGAADTTSTIKIIGMGNFDSDTAKTATWKITAPTRDFSDISITEGYGGSLSDKTVTMKGSDWKYFAADSAPDGSNIAGWYAGMRLKWPVANFQFTRSESALHTLSTNPGEQFRGNALDSVVGLSADVGDVTASSMKYMEYTYWYARLTPELAEACGDEDFVRTMTACGIKWSKSGSLYSDSDGVREVTCTVTQPMAGLALTVPENTTYDLGATVLGKCSLKLAKDAQVTTTVEQDESKIFTDEVGFQIYSGTEGGVTTYACWTATEYVTVPDVSHATKVVKVGDEVKQPTEAGGSVYAVLYGDTVTITYTPDAGYETEDGTKTIENVTENTTLTDLPTVTATAYAITYELNGGENDPENPANYTIEDAVTLKNPTKRGYTFTGWEPEGVIAKGSTGDKSFAAGWSLNVYKVEYVMSNGVNHAENPTTYTVESDAITLKDPTRKGYEFTGWSPTNGIAACSISNRTFYATWTATVYKVEFRDAVTEETKAEPMYYTVETASPLALRELPTQDKYESKGWLTNRLDVAGLAKTSELAISEDMLGEKTFYVHFVFTPTPEDPSEQDAPQVVIPQTVLTNIVENADSKTADQINEELTTPDENGITKTERYVLQLDMDDENDVPVLQPVQTTSTTSVRVNVGNIAPLPANVANAEVRYSIETSATPEFEEPTTGEQQESPQFDLPLPDSGVKYYRVKIDLVKPE